MPARAIIVIFIALAVLLNCRKKDDQPAEDPSTTASTTTTTTGTPTGTGNIGPPVAVANTTATAFYGVFTTGVYSISVVNTAFTSALAAFTFSANPNIIPPGVYAGRVRLNGDSLTYSASKGYQASAANPDISKVAWSVSGNTTIPAFNFTNAIATPAVADLSALPAAISLSTGIAISLSGISSAKSGTLFLTDEMNGSAQQVFTGSSVTASFTPSMLNGFTSGSQGNFYLTMDNDQFAAIKGKDFRFVKEVVIVKPVTINP